MDSGAALPLVLMTVGAIAMPALARKVAIPVAVAEIAYGVAIGKSGLGLAAPNEFTAFLADLGFAFFLFLAGLEIDFRGAEKAGLRALTLPVTMSSAAFVLAMCAAYLLDWGLWVGLAIGATSVPLLLSVVREANLNGTPLGATMIGFAAVGETLTILLLSVVEVHQHARGVLELVWGIGQLALLVIAVAMTGLLLRTLLWWYPASFARLIAHDDPAELGVRVGFGLMFAFIGLSLLTGVEPFLGAFIAGTVLTWVIRDKGALEHKMASMAYGFFVPVFFIHVGTRLDLTLRLVVDNFTEILLTIGVMFAVKALPSLLLLLRGLRVRELAATGCLLAAPLTLVIAIMDLGVRAGAISPQTESIVITAGISASLLFPSIARGLLKPPAAPEPGAAR